MATLPGGYTSTDLLLVSISVGFNETAWGNGAYFPQLGYTEGDEIRPQIQIISPPPGSQITPSTRLSFAITDNQGIRRALPAIQYTDAISGKFRYEVIHDGEDFTADFSGTRIIDGGNHIYHVDRVGGWKEAPTLVPFAFDTGGNEPS